MNKSLIIHLFLSDAKMQSAVPAEKKEIENERKLMVSLGLYSKGQYCNHRLY